LLPPRVIEVAGINRINPSSSTSLSTTDFALLVITATGSAMRPGVPDGLPTSKDVLRKYY
jgi:hypothetical protein